MKATEIDYVASIVKWKCAAPGSTANFDANLNTTMFQSSETNERMIDSNHFFLHTLLKDTPIGRHMGTSI